MKKVSVLIPTFNEVDNVVEVYENVREIFVGQLNNRYDYEILFIDNCSTDGTRNKLRTLAKNDPHIKVIFNARNFGWTRSSFYGLINTTGDCTIFLSADMQEPPEIIEKFIYEWENGNKIVIGIKSSSDENKWMYKVRDFYYLMLNRIAEIEQIRQFMGFGLYDKEFIKVLSKLDDPLPYFRGIVSDLGYSIKRVDYSQAKRKHGKSHCKFMGMYDLAMLGITSYSKKVMRLATLLGLVTILVCFVSGALSLIFELFNIFEFSLSTIIVVLGAFAYGGIQLFFLGLLSEYIMNMNIRSLRRPLVVEEDRINFVKIEDNSEDFKDMSQ